MAEMLTWAGYEKRLRGQFRGTLLLPTNVVSKSLLSQQQQRQQKTASSQHCLLNTKQWASNPYSRQICCVACLARATTRLLQTAAVLSSSEEPNLLNISRISRLPAACAFCT
jgi:hypothetical protein